MRFLVPLNWFAQLMVEVSAVRKDFASVALITVTEFAELARLSRRQIDRVRKGRTRWGPSQVRTWERRRQVSPLPTVQTH
jgi:hypothetical protein